MNVELSQDDVQNIINAYDKDIKKMEQQEKEIDRLNNIIKELSKDVDMWNKKYNEQFNIINELDKYLIEQDKYLHSNHVFEDYQLTYYAIVLDKLKELKENK